MSSAPAIEMLHTETLVVGAGAAGLATAACLGRSKLEHLVLEQHDQVAHAWRNHYERLHLHTSKGLSALPGLPFGPDVPRYPTREQVVNYLEQYAEHHRIHPRFGERVARLRPVDGGWLTETQTRHYRSRNVVMASGYTRVPVVPTWPGQSEFRGECFHSSKYRTGARYSGQRVLVVGFGNSGGEIAIDLHEQGAHPTLAVRSPVNVVPRDMLGIPILAVGIVMSKLPARLADALSAPLVRAFVGDIRPLGLTPLAYGPNQQIRGDARIPLLDIGTIALARQGKIAIRPGVERFTEGGVVFTDGREEPFDAVVLATGYRPALEELVQGIESVADDRGRPKASGAPTALGGLYFCGFHVAPTGMLREIGIEARRIAEAIAAFDAR